MHVPLRVTYILFFVLLLYSVNSCMKLIHSLLYLMQIDEEILQEVVKMGFDRNLLVESLRNRVQNDVYHSWPFKLLVSFLSSRSQKKKKTYQFSNSAFWVLAKYFRLPLHTICYWTTVSVFPVAILELSFRNLWCVSFSWPSAAKNSNIPPIKKKIL